MAVPEGSSGYFRAQLFPAGDSVVHARIRFRVAFADEDPEVLVLQRFHFLRVPLAGDKELCGKEVRILIADGDVCHAALGLAGAVDAVRVDGVRVRDIMDEIGDEGEALCPNVFIRRHHAEGVDGFLWILDGKDDGRMLLLLFLRCPDGRAVALDEGDFRIADIRAGIRDEDEKRVALRFVIALRKVEVVRDRCLQGRISVSVLDETGNVRLKDGSVRIDRLSSRDGLPPLAVRIGPVCVTFTERSGMTRSLFMDASPFLGPSFPLEPPCLKGISDCGFVFLILMMTYLPASVGSPGDAVVAAQTEAISFPSTEKSSAEREVVRIFS